MNEFQENKPNYNQESNQVNNSEINNLFPLVIKHYQLKQFQEAKAGLEKIIKYVPNHADSWHLLGVIAGQQGDYSQAITCINHAIELKPNFIDAYNNLALTYLNQGKFKEAIKPLQKLTELQPNNAQVFFKLAFVYKEIGQISQAIDSLQQAIKLQPNHPIAYNNLGFLYREKGQLSQAENCFQQAIKQKPEYLEAYNNLGEVYREKGELNQARKYFQQAIKINPNHAQGYYNLGNVYRDANNLSEGIKLYHKAIEIDHNYFQALNNLGNLYKQAGDVTEAIKFYQQAIKIKADYVPSWDNLLFCLHYSSNYQPLEIYNQHQGWAETLANPLLQEKPSYSNNINQERRLRIGYVSGDFKTHSVAYFLESLLKNHDHNQFEIICYSNTKKTDATTERLRELADKWRDIYSLKDEQVAALIREDVIDILIDLSGHTEGNRLLVFARKPAPIQVTYLGYPNTTGLNAIDYRFTDVWADTKRKNDYLHSEKLVYLPHGFLCYQPLDNSPQVDALPALSNNYITFGCFNNLPKVTPELISYWAEILKALPTSKLILKSKSLSDTATRKYFQQLCQQHKINPQQIEMIGWIADKNQHLSLYNQIDIALDTFPYHGTTTTCEALWMGVPVITLAGKSHVSRVGVSLLSSVRLEDFIAYSVDDYIQKAIALANNQKQLQQLRANLRQQMLNAPLTNGKLITKSIEDAYGNMWKHWCQSNSEFTTQKSKLLTAEKQENVQAKNPIVTKQNGQETNTDNVAEGKKLISFCLWGDNPKYTIGAIKNAELAPIIYPGWICRFYVAPTVPSNIVNQLCQYKQVEVVKLNFKQDWEASLWRFFPAAEKDVAIMICRDTDSRLNWREKAAVEEWLKSDQPFHIMRDHPLHLWPIMAGMWGVKKGVFEDIIGMIEAYLSKVNPKLITYGIDQKFLANIVYPLVQDLSLIHDEFFAGKPFPQPRNNYEFVGQSFEADDTTPSVNIGQLKSYLILRSRSVTNKQQWQAKLAQGEGYSRKTLEVTS